MAITISVLGLIILLLVLFVIFRKKNQPAGNPSNAATIRLKETSEFHSASIRLGARACDAAKQMSGQRILSKEVPGLPLPDCDRAECYCKFVHHSDHRQGQSRRSPFASGVSGDTGKYLQEQRENPDDRRADLRDDEY